MPEEALTMYLPYLTHISSCGSGIVIEARK